MIRSYLRLVLFALGLLVGVQVPGLMASYGQRVEAHRIEAEQGLSGFRETARQFFKGDLQALVAHYRNSADPVFASDAASLETLVERATLLGREWQAMQGPWYGQAWHLAFNADPALRLETWRGYTYQILLAPGAIAWGLGCALALAWLVETLLLLLSLPLRRRVRPVAARQRL